MSATAIPGTSLILPSRNRPTLLAEAVASVLAGNEVPAELIILDQSDAPHDELARTTHGHPCDVRYMWARDRGLSRAVNAGIRAANHSLLVFTHDDCLATPTWFGAITRALREAGERTVVTGRVAPGEQETTGGFVSVLNVDETPVDYVGRVGRDVLFPNNMAFYRRAVDEVGFFDERFGPGARFPAAEDNDFGFRLLEAGFRIRYAPEATVTHRAWRGSSAFVPLRWAYGRGVGAFYVKHLRRHDRYMLDRLLWDVRRHVRRLPGMMLHDRRYALADIAYTTALLVAAAEWMITRPK